ncbi:cytochrome bc1 complex Rieske iron-sulfur subunit [Sediminivirga luteola]|uniref:Cytochrome bc1 complex Rieske iron-sulfur subunit n=1 Tax=Sediminivirga luteola TaxID=1774748 RepID=A0A8J2U024_9MICO|nr:Rieske 2Fe-2S domain-containing protein [Sediminivirga luteola]GGA22853.1 ubiquinol-cytochrome c reductase [Sediminivirga luteola]
MSSKEHTVTSDELDVNGHTNPGLPEHKPRLTDTYPEIERRFERQVAGWFVLSMLGTVLFIVSFIAIEPGESYDLMRLSNTLLGLGATLALLGIGVGAIVWAKNLMNDHEVTESRHDIHGSEEDRAIAVEIIKQAKEESGIARRPLIRNTLIAALALAPLPAVIVFRELGPLPGDKLFNTLWDQGVRLAIDTGGIPENPRLLRAEDVTIGSVVHVIPENIHDGDHALDEKAKAAVLLMKIDPDELNEDPERADWSYDGIVAYSKICTHVGCPVALYEHQTHHLLCPCHQSTFDVTDHCKVIFGPAKRPLPQLPITVDSEGYLVAQSDFPDPVGPTFWEINTR